MLKTVSFERYHRGLWIPEEHIARRVTITGTSICLRLNKKIAQYFEIVRGVRVEMLEGPLAGKREDHEL